MIATFFRAVSYRLGQLPCNLFSSACSPFNVCAPKLPSDPAGSQARKINLTEERTTVGEVVLVDVVVVERPNPYCEVIVSIYVVRRSAISLNN
jgi:hypothetical protein